MDSSATPGPDDPLILKEQDNHISSDIWDGKERGVLRCLEHTSILERWKLTGKQIELVEKAGFGYLRLMPAVTLDCALISALVERWRKETNTFHFSVGEMTITLEDVALLLGLSIDGKPVTDVDVDPKSLCENLLGKAPIDFKGAVKLTWLKEVFSECPEDAGIEQIEYSTRAYLLYLLGSTIFASTSGNKVSVMYLSLFKDFDEAGKYAWGAAALAFLYRALGNASLKSQRTISGSLTLLQCWSYYHLNIGRPKLKKEPENCFPFLLKWTENRSGSRMGINLPTYRKALDSLQPSDVQWLPYKDMDFSVVPDDIKNSLVLSASRTMLICFDKAEKHLPDRCLRQFGLPQPIPKDVEDWKRKICLMDSKEELPSELKEWSDRYELIENGVASVDESEYLQWYEKITRKFVGRAESWESRFRQTIKAMHEVVKIVNSISTNGMDREDRKLFSNVKTMVHKCWIEKYADSPSEGDSTKRTGKRRREG
ncbi:protein MAIN-LIKE 2-like isoform X1 [Cucurbita maxima]|uniref:Protein MAIN-LIKE 2-like isoform X1 n=2 Tax=Cucurbita maxima TaxID=3661 RepID=A0A6J1K290_CUCMA|nr:protein MAIN-LIKE 2-like isoform X1 [Cucurbita maxima]